MDPGYLGVRTIIKGKHMTTVSPGNNLLCTRSMSCSWPYLADLYPGGAPGQRLIGLEFCIAFVTVCKGSRVCCNEDFLRLAS